MADNILEIRHLSKSFGTHEVLRDIDFDVKKGDVISIIGASGSGKSTLLRCATLLTEMDGGGLLYDGEYAAKNDPNGRSVYSGKAELKKIRSIFGLVFQSFNLFPHYSVLKNLMDPQICVLGRSKEDAQAKAMELLGKMNLSDKADAYPCQLSAVSSSELPSPGHSQWIRRSCFSTSRRARSTRSLPAKCSRS